MFKVSVQALLGAAAAASLFIPNNASAYAEFWLDGGDNDAIIGEWLQPVSLPLSWPPTIAYIPSGMLGVCWTDSGGVEHLELFSSCGSTSSAAIHFRLHGGAGDDWIAVFREEHAVLGGWEQTCGNRPDIYGKLGPWPGDFSFGLMLEGDQGSDVLVGSPNSDRIHSSDGYLADNSGDLLCGQEGDDILFGDGDDTVVGVEEFADGGPGSDFFVGDYWDSGSGSGYFDVDSNVESSSESWSGVTSGIWSPAVMCAGVDDPINDWDAARDWRTF